MNIYIYMFILRRVTSMGFSINHAIGNNYIVVRKIENRDEFDAICDARGFDKDNDNIYAVLSYGNGTNVEPLYKKSKYFVMCSNGSTFENITYR